MKKFFHYLPMVLLFLLFYILLFWSIPFAPHIENPEEYSLSYALYSSLAVHVLAGLILWAEYNLR